MTSAPQDQNKITAESLLSATEEQQVVDAIGQAELATSGEIRVHLSDRIGVYDLDTVSKLFLALGMHKTELRNAVLIYVAVNKRTVTLVGDKAIHEKVDPDFWTTARDLILKHFKKSQYALGLVEGIHFVANELSKHFPYSEDDVNELPNQISRS